jgi:hypothetical protein
MDNMRQCFIHKQRIESIFQLLGEKENDITYSLGWALSQSDTLFIEFLKSIQFPTNDTDAEIHLQKYEGKGKGFTDIEVKGKGFHLIIEAKRGWTLPSVYQLRKYESRMKNLVGKTALITLSECSKDHFQHYDKSILSAEVIHIPWRNLYWITKKAMENATHSGKRLLRQFTIYLERIMPIQNRESNWVYVVSVASGTKEGWKISWRDIVERKLKYFHPISGGGWPNTPPNYIAFRYDGKLQSIHHIDGHIVTEYVHDEIEEIPKEKWTKQFVYKLGPAIKPQNEVRTGKKIHQANRVWCMLDTLLTSKTISEAMDISKKRQGKSGDTILIS